MDSPDLTNLRRFALILALVLITRVVAQVKLTTPADIPQAAPNSTVVHGGGALLRLYLSRRRPLEAKALTSIFRRMRSELLSTRTDRRARSWCYFVNRSWRQ